MMYQSSLARLAMSQSRQLSRCTRTLHSASTMAFYHSSSSAAASSFLLAPNGSTSTTAAPASSSSSSAASLSSLPPIAASSPASVIPKQKVGMYRKLLRVLRSPVQGRVKNSSGDDYLLGQEESESEHAGFPGLITANLTGAPRKRATKKSGKETGRSFGQGGRKASIAKVWIQKATVKGTGDFYVNGQRYVEYFSELDHRWEVCAPFFYTGSLTDFDMIAVVNGGGRSGQAGAIKHAAAKALQSYDRTKYRPMLKKKFLLSRDARVVERKKYGQLKARKRFTYVRR